MWLFTKSGFVSLAQHPQEPEMLLVQTRTEAEMASIVQVLDKIAGQAHQVGRVSDVACPFVVTAKKSVAAQMLAQLVEGIDYTKLIRSVHFDFGSSPEFLLWMTAGGLQIARVNPE
jgi:hypothetical protein